MWLGLVTGVLGSFHCIGMCGALALSIPQSNLSRMLWYNVGRILTYAMMGVLLGGVGKGISLAFLQQYFSVAMGGVIVLLVIFRRQIERLLADNGLTKTVKNLFARFLGKKDMLSVLMIGMLNGLLPCGLVYVALAGAMAMADAWAGAIYMALFGIGTSPAMMALMFSPRVLSVKSRQWLSANVSTLTLAVGFLLIVRGLNLGIPYLSPKIEAKTEGKSIECCTKHP